MAFTAHRAELRVSAGKPRLPGWGRRVPAKPPIEATTDFCATGGHAKILDFGLAKLVPTDQLLNLA